MLGLLLAVACLLAPASGAAAQTADVGTPATPSPDQIAAEHAARTAQPSPAPGPRDHPRAKRQR
jgi:hypothetical protein